LKENLARLREALNPLEEFNKTLIEDDSPRIVTDIDRFTKSLKQRERQNEKLRTNYRQRKDQICTLLNTADIDESLFDIEELATLSDELTITNEELAVRLKSYQNRIEKLEQDLDRYISDGLEVDDPVGIARIIRNEVILVSQDLLSEMADDVLSLQLIQAKARVESVLLPEVEIEPATALQIARVNRRDWANARADLVNQWRAIEVVADDLESNLDIVFSGDVRNVGDNPLRLRSSTGQLRMGLQWDAPITRLIERNNYRAILIGYEQAKRDLYSFEDGVWQQLRSEIRQLQANQLTFELGRQAVGIAASQIELNTDIRGINEARNRSSGPTAARDAISALNDLLRAQNTLLDIFVNYEVVRRSLDLDLGTMELTPEGLWIDPGKLDPEYLLTLSGTTQSGMAGACNDCCLPRRPLPPEPVFAKPPMEFADGDPIDEAGFEAESFLRSN